MHLILSTLPLLVLCFGTGQLVGGRRHNDLREIMARDMNQDDCEAFATEVISFEYSRMRALSEAEDGKPIYIWLKDKSALKNAKVSAKNDIQYCLKDGKYGSVYAETFSVMSLDNIRSMLEGKEYKKDAEGITVQKSPE